MIMSKLLYKGAILWYPDGERKRGNYFFDDKVLNLYAS